MRKTYKCSNIKFCMEDKNQRRTWEYLQGMTRKDGSYGKILSDVFVSVLNGQIQDGMDGAEDNKAVFNGKSVDEFGEMLDRILEQKFCEMLQELQKVLTEQIGSQFRECISAFHSDAENFTENTNVQEMEQMQEPELSEDMMAFAFAMGE